MTDTVVPTPVTRGGSLITGVHTPDTSRDFQLPIFDLYRDIHKGIRAELFAVTASAGYSDPSDPMDRAALAQNIADVFAMLDSHAEHEDAVIDPVLSVHLPQLAEQIVDDHHRFDAAFARIVDISSSFLEARDGDHRRLAQWLHLELAEFTGAYLIHQNIEERQVGPELERIIGPEAVVGLHQAIVGSIPPDEMARTMAFMLPAMNTGDRVEVLEGIRMTEPPEAFDAMAGLARSVLQPNDFDALAVQLGIA